MTTTPRRPLPHTRILTVGLVALLAAAGGIALGGQVAPVGAHPSSRVPSSAAAAPAGRVRPAHFRRPGFNRWFPLRPGTVFRLRGTDEGEHLTERVHVTHRTKRIVGVRTRVVTDVVRDSSGRVVESTDDWYAVDHGGTVWYFGERTATYGRHGHVQSREGSWEAGRHGARAGVIMPAHPRPTDAYRQEFRPRVAEDQAWIVQSNTRVQTARRTYRHVVRSFEWSRLEPGVISVKLFAPGFGLVREKDLAGGAEVFDLVTAQRP